MKDYLDVINSPINPDRTMDITDRAGQIVGMKTSNGSFVDLRMPDYLPSPPYLAMSPCPHCGAPKNRGHNLSKHIDPFLGEKIC
jgi:hypothetical protein